MLSFLFNHCLFTTIYVDSGLVGLAVELTTVEAEVTPPLALWREVEGEAANSRLHVVEHHRQAAGMGRAAVVKREECLAGGDGGGSVYLVAIGSIVECRSVVAVVGLALQQVAREVEVDAGAELRRPCRLVVHVALGAILHLLLILKVVTLTAVIKATVANRKTLLPHVRKFSRSAE